MGETANPGLPPLSTFTNAETEDINMMWLPGQWASDCHPGK